MDFDSDSDRDVDGEHPARPPLDGRHLDGIDRGEAEVDGLVRSGRPAPGTPTPATVDRQRALLRERMAQADGAATPAVRSGRRLGRRVHLGTGGLMAAAAVAVVAAAVATILAVYDPPAEEVSISAGASGDDDEDGATTAPSTTSTTSTTAPSTTVVIAPGPGGSGDGAGDGGGVTVVDPFEGEDLRCGAALPDAVEVLPGGYDEAVPLDDLLPGEMGWRLTRDDVTVEYRWPAPLPVERAADGDEASEPRWPESTASLTDPDGLTRAWLARDPSVPVDRVPPPDTPLYAEPMAGAMGPDGTEVWVIDQLSVELVRQGEPLIEAYTPCDRVAISAFLDGELIDRFDWDLSAAGTAFGRIRWDIEPVIRGTREVAVAPTEAVLCAGGAPDTPPNRSGDGDGSVHPDPLTALNAFLVSTDADGFWTQGWEELVLPGGGRVYGIPFPDEAGTWLQLVAVDEVDGGWTVATWTTTGC